jgi:aspartyl-tRNA(Asn)/glutamyl-tRNA(Gln) amidotransferase subunit A
MLAAIAGGSDATLVDEPVPDYGAAVGRDGLEGVRIGVERDYFFYDGVAADVRTAVEVAIGQLRSLGATIVDVPAIAHIGMAAPAAMSVLVADTSEWHQRLLRRSGGDYVRETRVMLELGELGLATSYVKAQRARRLVQQGVRAVFEHHRLDALAMPTLPVTTMPTEQLALALAGEGESALSAFLHHCFPANAIGIPALSVPAGFSADDLPIGLQLYGRPFGEPILLRIGGCYQSVTTWHERRPPAARLPTEPTSYSL